MRILDQIEVENIISQGRLASEQEITAMLDELETKHPVIYRVIYGEPSDAISVINKEMADLYLDLSCDVIWLFIKAFGKLPEIDNEEQWVIRDLSLIDAELKALTKEIPMNSTFRYNLQNRFVKRSFEAKIQLNLLQYLENKVEKYASFKKNRSKAVHVTNNLLLVLVRLMGDLYNTEAAKSA
jgi:hypothetical protein